MGKIDELIKQLCPDGVKSVILGEVCKTLKKRTLKTTELVEGGEYPVINSGRDWYGFYDKFNNLGNAITIAARGEYAGFVTYVKEPFWAGGLCYPYRSVDENILITKFLFYVLKNNERENMDKLVARGSIPALNKGSFEKIEIPLPPLAVQKEIAEVLDTFTGMIDSLQKELEQRQKQFEYYKEKWLTFEEGKATVMKVGDLFDFKNGLNKEKSAFGQGTSIVNYTDVYKHRGLKKIDLAGLVTLSDKEIERYRCLKGDVFFTRTSETKEEVGFPSVLLEDIENCTFSGFVLRARPKTSKLLPEYCKYCFFTYSFRKEVIKYATLTTRALTNGGSLSKIKISIPSLEKQQEIVDKLDTFESLISNIKQEIELRQKQYEYYREKLLTFE